MASEELNKQPTSYLLRIIQHNAAKSPSLRDSISDYINQGVDLLVISECPRHHNLTDFSVIGLDTGGAAVIKLNSSLICDLIYPPTRAQVAVSLPQFSLSIYAFYIPPRHKVTGGPNAGQFILGPAIDDFAQLTQTLSARKCKNALICGDLNIHSDLLTDSPGYNVYSGSQLALFHASLESQAWEILNTRNVNTFTRVTNGVVQQSAIDWSICSSDITDRCTWQILPDDSASDHIPILITFTSRASLPPPKQASIIDFKKLHPLIARLSPASDLHNGADLIIDAALRSRRPVKRSRLKPWWNSECQYSKQQLTSTYKQITSVAQRLDPSKIRASALKYRPVNSLLPLSDSQRAALTQQLRTLQTDAAAQSKQHKKLTRRTAASFHNKNLASPSAISYCNNLLSRKPKTRDPVTDFTHGGTHYTDLTVASHVAIDHFFPQCDRGPLSCQPVSTVDDPPFELHELLSAIELQPDTAPGTDSINRRTIKFIATVNPTFLLSLFNHWLTTGHIPDRLKAGGTVLIRKPSFEHGIAPLSGCRPLGTSSQIIKCFERMWLRRVVYWLSKNNPTGVFSLQQYAHRSDITLEHALSNITSRVKYSTINCLLALDVANAFCSVDNQAIISRMCNKGVPKNLCMICKDYFENRTVFMLHHDRTVCKPFKRGTFQGSAVSAFLFNFCLDTAIDAINSELASSGINFTLVAFSDDLTFCIDGYHDEYQLERQLTTLISVVSTELAKIGLSLSLHKSQLLARNAGTRLADALDGTFTKFEIVSKPYLRILGLHYDRQLSFHHHIQIVVKRARTEIIRLAPLLRSRSLSDRHKDVLVKQHIYSKILFAVENWSHRVDLVHVRKILIAVDRLIMIYRYRLPHTIPSCTSIALSELSIFTEVENKSRWDMIRLFKQPAPNGLTHDFTYPLKLLPHPSIDIRATVIKPITCLQDITKVSANYFIYTDASRFPGPDAMSNQVGCAFIVLDKNHVGLHKTLVKLNPEASVYYAELYAIKLAAMYCAKHQLSGKVVILSDSQSAINALSSTNNNCISRVSTQLAIREARHHANYSTGSKICLTWVKAHTSDLLGNIIADTYAKQAALSSSLPITRTYASPRTIKSILKMSSTWSREQVYAWHSSGKTFKQFFPSLDLITSLKPTFNSDTLRIYTGHGAFVFDAHKYFPNQISPICLCGEEQDIEHLLIRCTFTLELCHDELLSTGILQLLQTNVPWTSICVSKNIHQYIAQSAKKILSLAASILDTQDKHGYFSFR